MTNVATPIRELQRKCCPGYLLSSDPHWSCSHTFNPDRYLGDDFSCADSSKLSNVMQRDHWTFGVGYVNSVLLGTQLTPRTH